MEPRMNRTDCFRFLSVSLLAAGVGLALLSRSAESVFAEDAVPAGKASAHAESLTQDLLEWNARYGVAEGAERGKLLGDLISAAVRRRELLSAALEENPGAVLRVRLPEDVRATMPPVVRQLLEEEESVEGQLEILHETHEHSCRRRSFLISGEERIELHFANDPPLVAAGAAVRVRGLRLGGALAVDGGETSVTLMPLTGDEEVVAQAVEAASLEVTPVPFPGDVVGEQRTVVLLANFQDAPEERPWTLEEVDSLVFGTVSDYFFEASYGRTWLTGEVVGWFTLSIDKPSCHWSPIQNEVDAAATASGVDLSVYDRIIYLFPKASGCRYSGTATMGALPSRAWINGELTLGTFGHELSHNFLLYHARGLDCQGTVLRGEGVDCSWQEYGDGLSILGNGTGHLNGPQKERLGWLGAADSPDVTTVETNGVYAIEPYESATPGPKVLNVLRGVDPVTGVKSWYYLEYRQPLGFDAFLFEPGWFPSYRENLIDGVVFHTTTENPPGSVLLDMTPESILDDLRDPALEVGMTYHDAGAGITITTVSADPSGATVSITFDGPTCSHARPAVAVSPSASQWVPSGTPVTYEVTVTNRDEAICAAASFAVSVAVPSGWSATVENPSLVLSPGSSGSTSVEVTSSAAATDGFYDLVFAAENEENSALYGSATATYVVTTEVENRPPVATDDSARAFRDTPVSIDVLGNDWDPDADEIRIVEVTPAGRGAVSIAPDGTITYAPLPGVTGEDSFTYSITDGTSRASAVVSVSVSKGKGGTGKGKKRK